MKILNNIVYFASIFISLMAIVLMLVNNELGYVPGFLKYFMLSLIFIVGSLLFIIVYRGGVRASE